MPLLDHSRPPASETPFESFHVLWTAEFVAQLNRGLLPRGYYANAGIHFGRTLEVDVAALERLHPGGPTQSRNGGGTAVLSPEVWAPPAPAFLLPTEFPDSVEVQVFSTIGGGAVLAAVIELVSLRNKDRPESRAAFAAKCQAYLQRRVGLVVIDLITERRANLHNELTQRIGAGDAVLMPEDGSPYTVSYRPARLPEGDRIECWPTALVVGQDLPTVPLPLRDGPILPLDLETTYAEACSRSLLA
jgi:hypothetical protein